MEKVCCTECTRYYEVIRKTNKLKPIVGELGRLRKCLQKHAIVADESGTVYKLNEKSGKPTKCKNHTSAFEG